ncbi:MAG TPA: hypothetical protein VFP96_08295 [Candidatus Acidoferrum sp.]|nr:hypothetical protein [Candidatus Acidoferrum sp.]
MLAPYRSKCFAIPFDFTPFVSATPSNVDASVLASLGDSVKVVRIDGKSPGQAGYPLL